jgi:hypothetical protein
MAALKLRDPMQLFVLVESDDPTLHFYHFPRTPPKGVIDSPGTALQETEIPRSIGILVCIANQASSCWYVDVKALTVKINTSLPSSRRVWIALPNSSIVRPFIDASG